MSDVVSGEINTAALVGALVFKALGLPAWRGFSGLGVKDIDISIAATAEKRVATLEQVWSSKSQVKPGDQIEVTALLRTSSGKALVEKIPVDIPQSVNDKRLSLVVGSGSSLNILERRSASVLRAPRDPRQMVRALNRMRRNNRLYALLTLPQRSLTLQGDEYPSPPPSLLQTFLEILLFQAVWPSAMRPWWVTLKQSPCCMRLRARRPCI